MKNLLLITILLVFAYAYTYAQNNTAANTIYTGTAQPFVSATAPTGAQRGKNAPMTIEGANLTGATEVLWNKPGITSKIVFNTETMRELPKLAEGQTGQLVIDKLTRNKLTIENIIAPDAAPGIYSYRIKTPMGTTNLGNFVITSLPDVTEKEMNDAVADAQEINLPVSISGMIGKAGDNDCFKFKAEKNQTLVFEVIAAAFGSRLDSVLTLMDEQGKTLATNDSGNGGLDSLLGYNFQAAGDYLIRITEFEAQKPVGTGMPYRLNIGEFPYLYSVFPLGAKSDTVGEVTGFGFNLGEKNKYTFTAKPKNPDDDAMMLKPLTAKGETYNSVRVALGHYPEILAAATAHNSPATAQAINFPLTINGKINDVDYYKFAAKKGQQIIFEVMAQRLGSPLDSVIEIMAGNGQSIPRATIRCELETKLTLRDSGSNEAGIRIEAWNAIKPGDYMMAGNEVVMIDRLPKGPDEDTFFVADALTGNRNGMLETTPEGHAINSPIYKVSIHPPGTKFSSNGLPIVTLNYSNDDGGGMYGKDSRLTFTAPGDGEYFLRLRDVRGLHGDHYSYRLSVHEPQPDFTIVADILNPNVSPSFARPIAITANRTDDFAGEIEVKISDLPNGWSAAPATIKAGQNSTILLLSAASNAVGGFPLRIQGSAKIGQQKVTREVNIAEKLSLVSLAPAPELAVFTDTQHLTVEPGGKVSITVSIKRMNGFTGRIPIDVRGLPHGIIVTDVGLNGILITPAETAMKFTIEVQPWVKPGEQPIFVVARIETTSPQRQDFPFATPIILSIKAKENAATLERK